MQLIKLIVTKMSDYQHFFLGGYIVACKIELFSPRNFYCLQLRYVTVLLTGLLIARLRTKGVKSSGVGVQFLSHTQEGEG